MSKNNNEKIIDTKDGQMREISTKPPYAFYVCGIFMIVYPFIFPLFRISDFFIWAGTALLVYVVADKLVKPIKTLIPVEVEIEYSGNKTADEYIKMGYELLAEIKSANKALPEEKISNLLDRIENSCGKILSHLSEHPEKANQLRKFFTYYLPTVSKLLKAQVTFETQQISGQNVTTSKATIEDLLSTVAKAFENQLDSLFADQALDISTEAAVLEGMLGSEGLTESSNQINM